MIAPKGMLLNPMYGKSTSIYDNQDMWIPEPLTASQIEECKWWDKVERVRCEELDIYRHKGLPIPDRLGSPTYHKEHGKLNVKKGQSDGQN